MFACLHCPNGAELPLADFAYSFSPLVEETSDDTVVTDVEGCDLRFGSAYGLASEIERLARRPQAEGGLGCPVNVSLAANPDAAVLAARFLTGLTFIAPGEELTALGDLAIENLLSSKSNVQSPTSQTSKLHALDSKSVKGTLDLGLWTWDGKKAEEILETLHLWGVRTFLDLANLPVAGVAARLGQEGVRLQQLAAGKTERHLKLKQAPPSFDNALELDYPIAELEPLSFIFARLLNQLCASLLAYALATNELRIQLTLENGACHQRTLSLPTPLRDHKTFLKLLLLDIEAHPPSLGVTAVAIRCEPVKPRVLQSGLFIPQAPEPAKLELTLARLAKLVGAENVGAVGIVDTHRPDTFQMKRFWVKRDAKRGRGDAVTGRWGDAGKGGRGDAGFRKFRPPLRALVDASCGYPQRVNAWGRNRSVYGKVVRLAGPWRKTGDWWRDDCWARDEWDIAVEGQAGLITRDQAEAVAILYRIYRELRSGVWFVEGVYD